MAWYRPKAVKAGLRGTGVKTAKPGIDYRPH